MSTNNSVLKGGLGSIVTDSVFSEVAENRQRATLDEARKMSFLDLEEDELPDVPEEEEDPEQQLIDLLDEYADKAYKWVLGQLATKHEYEYKLAENGDDYGRKKVGNGLELRDALTKFDEKLARVLQFCPDDMKECREFHDQGFAQVVCHRVRVMARLAVLVDQLLFAESKKAFEKVVNDAVEGGQPVFVTKSDGAIQGFKTGPKYDMKSTSFAGYGDAVFTGYHEFAFDQLSIAIGERASELSKAHDEEQERVRKGQRGDVNAKELLFGGAEETNEKTALLSWRHNRYENTIVVRRRDKALIVESVTGASEKDFRELDALNAEFGIKNIMVMLYNITDGDGLVPHQEDGKYRFNINVPMSIVGRTVDETAKMRKAWWNLTLKMTLWVRTAAGHSVPCKRIPDDEVEPAKNSNGNGFKLAVPIVDSDGREVVEPETFWFRKVNGGAGTVVIVFPEGSSLPLLEAKNEQQEIVAPERDVTFAKETKFRIRREIVQGRPKLVVSDCDNIEVFEEFRVNGFIEKKWAEPRNWNEMQVPWPNILNFGYGQACETGQIKPARPRAKE